MSLQSIERKKTSILPINKPDGSAVEIKSECEKWVRFSSSLLRKV